MTDKLTRISDFIWELSVSFLPAQRGKEGMRVPLRIIAAKKLIERMEEVVFEQSANVAALPGLESYVVILPDAHSGYGASIGTVFATNPENEGIISPGAVGYDINCGMRLMVTNLMFGQVQPKLHQLVNLLFDFVPAGVGREGFLHISWKELDKIMAEGAKSVIKSGFAFAGDENYIEEKGVIPGADPSCVSQKARERGKKQLATLGSGNHYLEIQKVAQIINQEKAKELGIFTPDQIVVMVHCGSRGLGHQIATDYLRSFENKMEKYKIKVNDLQLACAPFDSCDGQNYFRAMAAAANFAFANRQLITYRIREAFAKVFGKTAEELGMKLVYDVAHNIAKVEEHQILSSKRSDLLGGPTSLRKLVVHRKGATRSFPGQPVIIGGSMETGSYLLVGSDKSLELTFGSTAHGSGRTMSRHQAKKIVGGQELSQRMSQAGIVVKSASYSGLAEEAGIAYKNIADVVESVSKAGISAPVASFKPIGNIKG